MVALYITSLDKGTGKTAICAGLGKHLRADGKKIGYLKPNINKNSEEVIDSDAWFIKQLFNLEESTDLICPVIGDESNPAQEIKEVYARVSQGKDVIIIEGVYDQSIAEALAAKVIVVESDSKKLLKAGASRYKDLADNLLGVVLNKVPSSQVERVHSELSAQPDEARVNILGVLPEDRTLFTLTIGELAEHIQGEILNCPEKTTELAENFMLGAMCVDPGPEYFGRKDNKVVVVRGERPDMQLAALETSTKGLILSGNRTPTPDVLSRAKTKEIPIILAQQDDTTSIVTSIEDALSKTGFHHENKLPKLTEIMEQYFNFQAIYKELGLSSSHS